VQKRSATPATTSGGLGVGFLGVVLAATPGSTLYVVALVACLTSLTTATALLVLYLKSALPTVVYKITWRLDYHYVEHAPMHGDFERVCRVGRDLIGEDHPDPELLRDRVARNGDVLLLVWRVGPISEALCGYTVVYPLTAAASEAIRRRQIRKGTEISLDGICRPGEAPSALYVGMVLGTNRGAKAYVKSRLRSDVLGLVTACPSIQYVYARPGTAAGRTLMIKFKFEPIAAATNSEIWVVDAASLRSALEQ